MNFTPGWPRPQSTKPKRTMRDPDGSVDSDLCSPVHRNLDARRSGSGWHKSRAEVVRCCGRVVYYDLENWNPRPWVDFRKVGRDRKHVRQWEGQSGAEVLMRVSRQVLARVSSTMSSACTMDEKEGAVLRYLDRVAPANADHTANDMLSRLPE